MNSEKIDSVLTTVDQLVRTNLVQIAQASSLEDVAASFSIRITPETLALIDPADPNDPIALQYVPSLDELMVTPYELESPIGDDKAQVLRGLLRKYPDRVLIKLVNVCATYCRFCFRRSDIGSGQGIISESDFTAIADYIANDPTIWEVILSGGDPLVLAPDKLHAYLSLLAKIDHVRSLRIHTRAPIVSPGVVSDAFLASLKVGKTIWIALHCNHPRELTVDVRAAIRLMTDAGILLLSQTVLLKNINDDVKVLSQLFRDLAEIGVKPFQLHHGDLARGTSHFRIPLSRGQEIFRALTKNLSSVCLPMYMLEIPGGYGKIPALEARLISGAKGEWMLTDADGKQHGYREELESDTLGSSASS